MLHKLHMFLVVAICALTALTACSDDGDTDGDGQNLEIEDVDCSTIDGDKVVLAPAEKAKYLFVALDMPKQWNIYLEQKLEVPSIGHTMTNAYVTMSGVKDHEPVLVIQQAASGIAKEEVDNALEGSWLVDKEISKELTSITYDGETVRVAELRKNEDVILQMYLPFESGSETKYYRTSLTLQKKAANSNTTTCYEQYEKTFTEVFKTLKPAEETLFNPAAETQAQ